MKELLRYKHKFNGIILDLGANAGLEAVKLFKEFGNSQTRVILVEPILENLVEIQKNVKAHGLENNFFVEHCCVHTSNGYFQFGYHFSDGMSQRINGSLDEFNWRTWNYTGKRIVKAKTINEICPNPSIVKIDIERHEYVVLPEIAKLSSIEAIFCELHGPCYPLNIREFIDKSLEGTGLKATGYYWCDQNQQGADDVYQEIVAPETINCSDYKHVVIERVE